AKVHWLRFRKAEQPSPFLRYPKFVFPDVPNPQTEVRRVGCEGNACFALAQRGLAGLEPLGKLCRAEEVVAQLIAHRGDDAQVRETDKEGRFDDSPNHQRGKTCQAVDRKSTRLNSSHLVISYAVFC